MTAFVRVDDPEGVRNITQGQRLGFSVKRPFVTVLKTALGVPAEYIMKGYYSTTGTQYLWLASEVDLDGSETGLPDPENLSNISKLKVIR